MPRFADRAKDFPVLIQLDDPVISSVGHPNVLVGGNKEAIRIPDGSPLFQKCAVGIENLNSLVFAIANVHASFLVNNDRMRQIEFSRRVSEFAPGFYEVTFGI